MKWKFVPSSYTILSLCYLIFEFQNFLDVIAKEIRSEMILNLKINALCPKIRECGTRQSQIRHLSFFVWLDFNLRKGKIIFLKHHFRKYLTLITLSESIRLFFSDSYTWKSTVKLQTLLLKLKQFYYF